jgi:hypothetical protein
MNQSNDQNALAQHIRDALKDHPGPAEVRINPNVQAPVPEHIAKNLIIFLQRTQVQGMEALAWCEAFQYLQQFAPQPAPQGVPFTGLPPAPPK